MGWKQAEWGFKNVPWMAEEVVGADRQCCSHHDGSILQSDCANTTFF